MPRCLASGLLHCGLFLPCYILPKDEKSWPTIQQIEESSLKDYVSREGVSWIMTKPDSKNAKAEAKGLLRSRIYFSTSEYGAIPHLATDLLPPFIEKIRAIWDSNCRQFQKRLLSSVSGYLEIKFLC